MTLVIDASVIVKWLLRDPEREAETEKATQVMRAIVEGGTGVVQPVHWLAEVASVLARLSPATAEDDVLMLRAMELPVDDSAEVFQSAGRLAIDLGQHVFDTLYHATALQSPDAVLLTADARYLRAGRSRGHLVGLSDWVVE